LSAGSATLPIAVAAPVSACPGEVDPVRNGEPLFADKDMRQYWNLQRFPFIWDHSVIPGSLGDPI
jgi:hypothetical protein